MKLKELRINAGLTQAQLADELGVFVPVISNYENDVVLPNLEEAIIIEKQFSTRIEWKEDFSPKRKHEVVQSIIELCENYPLPMVSEFLARTHRREKYPDKIVIHYAKAINNSGGALYFPNTVKDK